MSWKSPMGPAAGDGTPQESFPERCFISTSKRAEDSEKKKQRFKFHCFHVYKFQK